MAALALQRMTADEFIVWAMDQPEGQRYELCAGEIVAMAPERSINVLTKLRVTRAFEEAIEAAGLPCTAYPDGMAVRVDERTIYVPDAFVRCGARLPDDAVEVIDPMIVVEVVSPSAGGRDLGAKLEDYLRMPSVRHYLILKTENRTLIHHARDAAGDIATRILRTGTLALDPPGLTVEVEALFA